MSKTALFRLNAQVTIYTWFRFYEGMNSAEIGRIKAFRDNPLAYPCRENRFAAFFEIPAVLIKNLKTYKNIDPVRLIGYNTYTIGWSGAEFVKG